MTPTEYQLETRRTRPAGESRERALAHYALGLCEEAGELAGIIKKHVFYGQPLDRDALIKEAGDVLWYLTSLLDTVDVDLSGTLNPAVEMAKEDEATLGESENATEADDGSEPRHFFGAATERECWLLYNIYGLLNECNMPVSYAFECNRVTSPTARHHSKLSLYHLYHLLSAFDIALPEVMAANVAKLRARYPGEGWTPEDAAERKDEAI